ncbi:MAG: response regulator [Gammaproteobacteria bacterium]|nr:response regulator [Gammaproteobacteria bacterium]
MIGNNKTILLVEDNKNDELLAIRALKKNNVTSNIFIARDGVEAINYIFNGTADNKLPLNLPELILLDLNLPKLNGLEVLKRLKNNEATAQIPIVMMTSSTEESDIKSSYALGANSYIRKPVDFGDFSSLISNLATYWLVLNRSPNSFH